MVSAVQSQRPDVSLLIVPPSQFWFQEERCAVYPFTKTWDTAANDPMVVFHTSGTTGLPKPIIYTHAAWAATDAWHILLKRSNTNSVVFHPEPGVRLYSPLPTLHITGMVLALLWTTYYDNEIILGPPDKPATAAVAADVIRYSTANSAFMAPSLHEELATKSDYLNLYSKLDHVLYGGSAMSESAGQKIRQHTSIQGTIGSSENLFWGITMNKTEDWSYFRFHPSFGATFEPKPDAGGGAIGSGELYELFFDRINPGSPDYAIPQIYFLIFPHDTRYATKDLWSKHPAWHSGADMSKEGLWKYRGRTDDMVVFTHGDNLFVSDIETEITEHPNVKAALVGGAGYPVPCLLLELALDDHHETDGFSKHNGIDDEKVQDTINRVWDQVVTKSNQRCSEYVRLRRELVVVASPDKPFVRLSKGSVDRRNTLALYEEEIERVYGQYHLMDPRAVGTTEVVVKKNE